MNRPLDENTEGSIIRFYEDEDIAAYLTEKKDVLWRKQQRLLLVNLKVAYEEWKKNTFQLTHGSTVPSETWPPLDLHIAYLLDLWKRNPFASAFTTKI